MRNYTSKILADLVGPTNFFQYSNNIFSKIYESTTYNTIKLRVESFSNNYKTEIERDLNYIGCENYSIKISNSDNHNNCKRVIFVNDFTNKKELVYKSKHIKSEPKIHNLFKKINEIFNETILITPNILCGQNGYFSKYTTSSINNNINDLLIHIGQLLPFVKILGLSDLHQENILIKDNRLWILDFESILNFSSLRVEILRNFNSSSSIFDEFSVLDSLLINPRGNGFEIDEIIRGAYNINEFCLSDRKHHNIILKGIQKSNYAITKHKTAFFSIIKQELEKEISCRFILRPTFFYSSIIKRYFSELHKLKSFEDLKLKLFDILVNSNDSVPISIINSEVESLSIGDIPVFYMLNDYLITQNETVYRFKSVSVIKIIENEINSVNKYEEDYIDYFKLRQCFLSSKEDFNYFPRRKIVNCDYAGLDNIRISFMGIDLYSGYPGFTLAYYNNEFIFKNLYINYLSLLKDENNNMKLNILNLGGAYEGLVSFLYYLLIVHAKYKDEILIDFIEKHFIKHLILKIKHEKPKYELMNGLFGQISIFDKYQTVFNNLTFDSFINENLKLDYGIKDIGLAHGLAGQLLMEIRLSKRYFNIDRIKYLQEKILKEFSFQHKNWKDYRTDSYDSYYWCNGGLGISLALKQSLKFYSTEKLLTILDLFDASIKEKYEYSHLCCGEGINSITNTNELIPNKYLYEERTGFFNLSFFNGRSGMEYFKKNNINLLLLE